MAHPHTNDIYPPAEIPKRHMPWFIQLMVGFALLVLAAVGYAFWQMGKAPARTLESRGRGWYPACRLPICRRETAATGRPQPQLE